MSIILVAAGRSTTMISDYKEPLTPDRALTSAPRSASLSRF
jgi:hypothetical protein